MIICVFVYYHYGFLNSDSTQLDIQMVPDLASGNPFRLTPVFFYVSPELSSSLAQWDVVSSPRALLGPALESDASPHSLAVSILQPCTSLLGTHLVPRPHAVPDMLLSKRQFNSLVLLKVTAMAFLKHWDPASILKGLWQFQYMLHNRECLEVQPQDVLGHRFKWASLFIINPDIYKPEIFLKLLEFIHYTRYLLI